MVRNASHHVIFQYATLGKMGALAC